MSIRLDLVFRDSSYSERLRASFQLLESSFTRKWLAAILLASNRNKQLDFCTEGARFVNEVTGRIDVEKKLEVLAKQGGVAIAIKSIRPYANAADFEPVLKECRKIVENENDGSQGSSKVRDAARNVIDSIGRYLSLYDPEHHFQVDFKFPIDERIAFTKSDFSQFTPDLRDGWIYLGFSQGDVPVLQKSVNTSFQLLYRDTHIYADSEKARAKIWVARQRIPLARPIHGFNRDEILERFINRHDIVTLEFFDGNKRLTDAQGVSFSTDVLFNARLVCMRLMPGLVVWLWKLREKYMPAPRPWRKIFYFSKYLISKYFGDHRNK